VRCSATPQAACVDLHRVDRGGAVQLRGRGLGAATQIVFYGRKGKRDDAFASLGAVTPTGAAAVVPQNAASGPVAVADVAGRRSRRWIGLLVHVGQFGLGTFMQPSEQAPVEIAVARPRTIFYAGMQGAVFSYKVLGTRPLDLRVNAVRLSDNAIVRTWERRQAVPGVPQRILWNGAARSRSAAEGRYGFRVTTPTVTGSVNAEASAPAGDAITLFGHIFPVRGSHDYGGGGGGFGAGRAGHSHQGQDVFASCGTPLVAARAGTVEYAGYHSAAGYYVVVDGKGTGADFAYMHLRQPSIAKTGDRLYTGQQLGEVGETGNASGCHLHFEEWSAPGWYKGGRPYDPLPDLRHWDTGS
jgi:murein DD-endopeptidase MepM/ murein hydrolase activator NlpD